MRVDPIGRPVPPVAGEIQCPLLGVEVLRDLVGPGGLYRDQMRGALATVECSGARERQLFVDKRDSMPLDFRPFLTSYTLDEYDRLGARLFLSSCGRAGYCLLGDQLCTVFCQPGVRLGAEMVREAIERGARALDCIDAHGKLSRFYSSVGFREVGRVGWVDDLAPAGWNYERFGRPDIVYMKILNS